MPDPTTLQHRAHRVGTHEWSLCTGGHLSSAEKRRFIPAVLAAQGRNVAGRVSMAARVNRGRRARVDHDRLLPPSSILTRVAEAHAAARLTPGILNHSRRAYAFGAALGIVDGVDVDHELLYAAALLHDVGLIDGSGDGTDFTLASAAVATQIAGDVGLSLADARAIASAITMHHSPDVRLNDGPVAYLMSAGAAVDVIGLRAWDIPPSTMAETLHQHPRLGFKREFGGAFRTEAARVPRGRARFLNRYAGFGLAIRMAPFED